MDKKLSEYIESLRPEMIKTLSELISYPSYKREREGDAPFGKPAKECLERALEIGCEMGFETKNVDNYAGTVKLGEGEPWLGILSHLDVVPEGDGWTRLPYHASLEDGRLYGRGAMDDKGPAVSVLYAMKALKDTGVPLKKSIELILGTDEECGSGDIRYFLQHEKMPPHLFTPDASYPLINIEKGRVAAHFSAACRSEKLMFLHGGRTINAVPASASAAVKGIAVSEVESAIKSADCSVKFSVSEEAGCIKISASGASAHASTPEIGDNALTALIKVLSHVSLDEPANGLISGLCRIFPYKETDGSSAGVKLCDEVSGALTLAFSILDYDGSGFSGALDIRFPVAGSVEWVSKNLGSALEGAGFEHDINGVEPHCVPSDSEFVRTLLSAYECVTGKKGECLAIGGGTYVHGIPGGVAFGCEIEGEDNRIHGADEYIRVDALVENAKIFAEAIMRICG